MRHKDTPKTLYNIELHEGLTTSFGIFIMRVPGGWMYDCWDYENDCYKQGTFVPFSNEFQMEEALYEHNK